MTKSKVYRPYALLSTLLFTVGFLFAPTLVSAATDTRASCEASGGVWIESVDPTNPAAIATACQPKSTSTGSSSTSPTAPTDLFKGQNDGADTPAPKTTHRCGSPLANSVEVSFDFGCLGPGYTKPLNPIIDVAFAIFRFLSAGVGLVVIGSIIIAGIQYSTSRGNPQATQAAIKRVSSALAGLLLYIFLFAFANFLVPGGMFIK
jgi:hypothetical protein